MYIKLKTVQMLLDEGACFNSSGDLKKYNSKGEGIVDVRPEHLRYLGTLLRVEKSGHEEGAYTAFNAHGRFGFYETEIEKFINHDFIIGNVYTKANTNYKIKVLGIGEDTLLVKDLETNVEFCETIDYCKKILKE